jgi:hypothetical protein
MLTSLVLVAALSQSWNMIWLGNMFLLSTDKGTCPTPSLEVRIINNTGVYEGCWLLDTERKAVIVYSTGVFTVIPESSFDAAQEQKST